jgi:hypothetical protein
VPAGFLCDVVNMAAPDKYCAHCAHYGLEPREPGGWAYCRNFNKHFPNQENRRGRPVYLRTCRAWEKAVAWDGLSELRRLIDDK